MSSDWNECLAPCGPFDFISHCYPQIQTELNGIFRRYTSNRITLSQAVEQVRQLLPAPITAQQMDAYLEACFAIYPGVTDLMRWCAAKQVLFMVNTTGMLGYFQRLFANKLLPEIPALSAHPMLRYPPSSTDPKHYFELHEIHDKAKNTEAVMRLHEIPAGNLIVMGDSGGDGPHFEWGAQRGAL
ncbi:MAG: hypothetical protein D6722_28390, partial [Bacteroidetes bacterium]